jgi:hypothetical protein
LFSINSESVMGSRSAGSICIPSLTWCATRCAPEWSPDRPVYLFSRRVPTAQDVSNFTDTELSKRTDIRLRISPVSLLLRRKSHLRYLSTNGKPAGISYEKV